MPNWCYNSIEVNGSPENIGGIKAVILTLKNSTEEDKKNNLFKALIGLPPEVKDEEYDNGGWYNTNINWFGTKWDVDVNEFVQSVGKDYILLSGETAWSPPINFCRVLAETYGVQVSMYYEEPGCDFCGKCTIEADGTFVEEDYEYQEGIYRFEGFSEWYEREFASAMEWMVEEHQDEDEPNFNQIISDNYGFLTEEEVEECASDLEKEMVAATGKEF